MLLTVFSLNFHSIDATTIYGDSVTEVSSSPGNQHTTTAELTTLSGKNKHTNQTNLQNNNNNNNNNPKLITTPVQNTVP